VCDEHEYWREVGSYGLARLTLSPHNQAILAGDCGVVGVLARLMLRE
jgi:hypothetical protein